MVPQRPSGDDQRPSYPPPRSFLHHLPPPIPSAPSPHSFPSPSGHTDPSSWASDRERPRSRWSPLSSFDRQSSRLPSLNDYPRTSVSGWEAPSPSAPTYPTWATRPSVSYHTSPSKPLTPITDHRPPSQHKHLPHPSAASTPGTTSPGKHATSDDGPSGKKKKRRVALSCAECAKRKQRCNRETPCQHCVARRVPELCIPYTRVGSPPPRGKETTKDIKSEEGKEMPAARQPGMLPTLSVRVARIEALLNAVVNKVDGLEGKALSDWRINHAPATTPPPRNGSRLLESVRNLSTSPSPSPPPTAVDLERESADMEGSRDGDEVTGLDIDSSMRNPLPQSMRPSSKEGGVSLGLDTHGTPAEQLQKLFQNCGVGSEKVQDLMQELPNEDHANRLLEWFFTKFNYVRYPIDEHIFRKSFEELYASQGDINPRSVLFLPLIFIVFSISTRIAPDEWALSEDDKRTQSLRYYWHSKNASIISKAVKAENIQLVETMILTGLYLVLMHDRRLAEAWADFRSAISIAQALGLHRDGTKLRLDAYTTEYRRRLWSYLIHADATYSCLLGRPTCLDPRFSDTKPPSNLEMTDLLDRKTPRPKPDSEPTFATYLILRRGLGEIVARVTDHFQMLGEAVQYRDVEAIDEDFKAFVAALPKAFRMTDPDRSWDARELWFLPVHRYYIQTEILHFTIILHRPWLLKKLRSSRYALSRTACIEAAATDFRIREAFKKDVPDFFETLLASSFREFNVAMIAGISIIISPYTPHLNEMRAILQNFMEQHPHDPSLDDFSKKESAIIYTLYHRAKELEERRRVEHTSRPMSSSLRGTQDNVSAERHEPMPVHRTPSGLLFGPNGTPLQGKSPLAGFIARQSPMNHQSGTNSPDDDQPQQLLDHWLMSNTSFGPPLSSLDPSQAVYPQPQPFQTALNYGTREGAWIDPPMQGMVPQLGIGTGYPPQHTGFIPAPTSEFIPSQEVPEMEGQWGDGNSAQYWNNLVDRISGALPLGYTEMSVPST